MTKEELTKKETEEVQGGGEIQGGHAQIAGDYSLDDELLCASVASAEMEFADDIKNSLDSNSIEP